MEAESAIQTLNLTKTYKTKLQTPQQRLSLHKKKEAVNAVDNLNLTIKKGELFGLLGPNGAGKTTLVKMLCTLLPPDGGTAKINGYDIIKEPMQVKRVIGDSLQCG